MLDWYTLSSLSYEAGHAYGMFQNLVRRLNNIEWDDSNAEARVKLETMLAPVEPAKRARAAQVLEIPFSQSIDTRSRVWNDSAQTAP